jgi:HTH-type transcriptional regulator / antitoxin HipB
METVEDIGGIVKHHRKRAGLTQQELARLAGVGKTAVFDLEKGKQSIQLDTLRKILHALNISIKAESPLMEEYVKKVSNEKS